LVVSSLFLFFNAPATPEIYTLSLHDALPIFRLHEFEEGAAELLFQCAGLHVGQPATCSSIDLCALLLEPGTEEGTVALLQSCHEGCIKSAELASEVFLLGGNAARRCIGHRRDRHGTV